jgi:hypothetical protein
LQVPLRRRPVPVEHERHEPGHDVRLGECFVELESPKGGHLRLRHPLDVRDGEEAIRHEVPGEREPGLRWLADIRIETALIDPGKPWQNGSNESFNGRFRDECLGMQWFRNRVEAVVLIEQWRREYNAVRPHSSLGQLTPLEFARKADQEHRELPSSRNRWSEESRQITTGRFEASA